MRYTGVLTENALVMDNGGSPGPHSGHYGLEFDQKELVFWFLRVSTLSISGTLSVNGTPLVVSDVAASQGRSGDAATELDAYTRFYFSALGFSFGSLAPNNDPLIANTLVEPATFKPSFVLDLGIGTTDFTSGSPPAAATIELNGTNLVDGLSYSHSIPFFSSNTVTGTVTITPLAFWPFDDGSGPKFNSGTGALI